MSGYAQTGTSLTRWAIRPKPKKVAYLLTILSLMALVAGCESETRYYPVAIITPDQDSCVTDTCGVAEQECDCHFHGHHHEHCKGKKP